VPPVTFAKEITVDGNKITIKRQSETGYDVVESTLPALVACSISCSVIFAMFQPPDQLNPSASAFPAACRGVSEHKRTG